MHRDYFGEKSKSSKILLSGVEKIIMKFDREIVIGKEIKLGSCLKIIFASRLNTVTIIYETVR